MKKIKLDIGYIKDKYLSGITTIEIAKELNVHPSTIQDRLKPFDILRKPGARKRFTIKEQKERRKKYDYMSNHFVINVIWT